jgi:putative membrane protein
MKKIALFLSLACFIACSDDDDDDDNNSGGNGTNNTSISAQDSNFVMKASMANYAEVQAGQLAANVSGDSTIQAFAAIMEADHQAALDELQILADSLGLYAPDSLDSAHVALALQLSLLAGEEFDSVYIHSQVTDHADALTLFQTEISSGTNTQIRNYAGSKITAIQMHKEMADSIANLH